MAALKGLKPEKVFEYFEKLCSVPHGSGNTKIISDLCVTMARELGLPILARLPIDPALAAACDAGKVEGAERNYLEEVAAQLDR